MLLNMPKLSKKLKKLKKEVKELVQPSRTPPPKSPDPDTNLRELNRSTEIVYLTIYQ